MKYIVISIAVTVFLLYILRNTRKMTEPFASDSSMIVTPAFKKNIDVVVYNKRANLDIPEINQILSRQIAPITDMYRGKKEKNNQRVSAINHALTERIPDDLSTLKEYVLPMPNFRDLQGDMHRPKNTIISLSSKKNKKDSKKQKSKKNQ